MRTDLEKVFAEAAQWGVTIRPWAEIPPTRRRDPQDFTNGPFGGAIQWSTQTIFWPARAAQHPDKWFRRIVACALLHEVSHVIAGVHPDTVDEINSGMLAYEWSTVRRLKISGWSLWMEHYQLPHNDNWNSVDLYERHDHLSISFCYAIRNRILSPARKPTFTRVAPTA